MMRVIIYLVNISGTGFDGLNLQKPTYHGLGGTSVCLTQAPYLFGQGSMHEIKPDESAIHVLKQVVYNSTRMLQD